MTGDTLSVYSVSSVAGCAAASRLRVTSQHHAHGIVCRRGLRGVRRQQVCAHLAHAAPRARRTHPRRTLPAQAPWPAVPLHVSTRGDFGLDYIIIAGLLRVLLHQSYAGVRGAATS